MAGANETLKYSLGFRNYEGKYLTAETFKFSMVCNSNVMKKKQIVEFQPAEGPEGETWGYFKTHLDHYLTADKNGKFTGDAEGKGPNELFKAIAFDDGRWVLISKLGNNIAGAQEYYVGGSGDKMDCYCKVDAKGAIPEDRIFTVQLAMHPQVCIRNLNRKKYVHYNAESNTLTTDEVIPWGDDALITLVFFDEGRYGLQASNGQFLSNSGALKKEAADDCKFVLVLKGEYFALRGSTGSFLSSAFDAKGTVKVTKDLKAIGKDELYQFEDSHPQIKLTDYAHRKVSVRSGVEVTQIKEGEVATDTECFQIEANPANNGTWAVRCSADLYWTMVEDGTICSNYKKTAGLRATEYFTIEWLGPKMAIKAANGKYIVSRGSGALSASGANNAVPSGKDDGIVSQYVFELINRPRLVLRGEFGFVGVTASGGLECNRSQPEIFNMHVSKGLCHIGASNGKFFKTIDRAHLAASGSEPEHYTMELLPGSRLLLRSADGKLFQGFQNGAFSATGTAVDRSTSWEY